MTATEPNFDELKARAVSRLSQFAVVLDGEQRFGFEEVISLRKRDELGVQFTVDWRDPYVFSLIWSPSESRCPVGYKSADGRTVKMYVQEALRRLNVDVSGFNGRMLSLRGRREKLDDMMELSLDLLENYFEKLNDERLTLFESK